MSYSSQNIHTYTTQKQTATFIKKYCLDWLNDEIGEERKGAAKKSCARFARHQFYLHEVEGWLRLDAPLNWIMKQVIIFDNMGISGALGHNALDLSELNMCNAFHVMIDCKWSRCMAALFAVILTKSAQTPMAPLLLKLLSKSVWISKTTHSREVTVKAKCRSTRVSIKCVWQSAP